jgi:hypothetical protein
MTDSTAPPNLIVGQPFDPADLTPEQAERVLEAVRAMPELPESAKDLYECAFRLARGERPHPHRGHRRRAGGRP